MKLKPLLALSIALTFALPSLSAQQEPKPPKPRADPFGAPGAAPPRPKPAPPAPPQPRFDIEFVDTPVSDACEYIASIVEDLTKQPINIVVSKEAEDIALPTMELRQITFEQWVSFINRIGGAGALQSGGGAMGLAGGMHGGGRGGGPAIPHTGPFFGMTETDGIWYFWAEKPNNEPVQLTTMVFPLGGDSEATLGLIEEALSESRRHGNNPEPTLKFHEPSGTLIATGGIEDLKLIDEVVEVMESREERLLKSRMKNERLDSEIRVMEHELAKLLERYTPEHASVIEMRKRIEEAIAGKDQKE